MAKKNRKVIEEDIIAEPNEKPPIDKNWAKPCRDCYKRDSCFITRPHNEICASFEKGTPWSIQYLNSLPDGY